MSDAGDKGSLIKATLNEFTKSYYVYDGSNRLSSYYVAPVDTADGKPCMLTTYTYVGASSDILTHKEIETPWDSSWDQ